MQHLHINGFFGSFKPLNDVSLKIVFGTRNSRLNMNLSEPNETLVIGNLDLAKSHKALLRNLTSCRSPDPSSGMRCVRILQLSGLHREISVSRVLTVPALKWREALLIFLSRPPRALGETWLSVKSNRENLNHKPVYTYRATWGPPRPRPMDAYTRYTRNSVPLFALGDLVTLITPRRGGIVQMSHAVRLLRAFLHNSYSRDLSSFAKALYATLSPG